jgi:hypothetical protein
MSENVYVVGTDMIRFGRFPEKSVPELGAEAAQLALKDAGVKIQDVEALYCGNLMQASAMVGQRILQEIGQTGIPGDQQRQRVRHRRDRAARRVDVDQGRRVRPRARGRRRAARQGGSARRRGRRLAASRRRAARLRA